MSEIPSVRMRLKDRTNSLNGYVFRDLAHARQWLSQAFVKPDEISLDTVSVGPIKRCPRCNGDGYTEIVRFVGKTTVEEFLAKDHPTEAASCR